MNLYLKKRYFLIFLLATALPITAQKPLTLKGTISNFQNKTINVSLYSDWAAPLQEFYFNTDEAGRFEFSHPIKDYAYVNLNIGKYGYLFWLAKGGDNIYMLMDYDEPDTSFFVSGVGASKWSFQHEFYQKYEKGNDLEFQVNQAQNKELPQFIAHVDSITKTQNEFLELKKEKILGEFFLLQKAEIIGRKNRWLTAYALSNRLEKASIADKLEFYSASPERQALSFEFNRFFDLYIDLEKRETDFEARSLSEEIGFIKNLFLYGKMERPIAELKVHQRMIDFVDNHVFTTEMEKAYQLYQDFVRNESIKSIVEKEVERRRHFKQGFALNPVILSNADQELRLKDLKKRNTLIYVFDTSCIICEEDFDYFKVVQNNFDKKEKFQVILIQNESADQMMQTPEHPFDIYQTSPKSYFNKSFSVKETPQVYFIDKEGRAFGDLPAPSDDEGRNLIKALKSLSFEPE